MKHKTLCILTGQIAKTQGDISAAFKVINATLQLNNQDVNISINWLIYFTSKSETNKYYDYYIQQALAKNINVVCITQSHDLVHNIQKLGKICDLYMLLPATPFRVGNLVFLDIYKKPILVVTEYNYRQVFMLDRIDGWPLLKLKSISKYVTIHQSGFGSGKLGILTNQHVNFNEQLPFQPMSDIDQKLFTFLGMLSEKTSAVSKNGMSEYSNKNTLYFAYFNATNTINVINRKIVNASNFCLVAICLAMQRADKNNLDLIVQFSDIKPKFNLTGLVNKYSKIIFVNHNLEIINATILNNNHCLPIIRVIDPFPISNATFTFLLEIAQPFAGLTGDQSLTEGIEQHKLVFYQIMEWKADITQGFLELCAEYIGKDSALFKFYNIVLVDNSLLCNGLFKVLTYFVQPDLDAEALAKFIIQNEHELLAQMVQFGEAIKTKHDLSKNLLGMIKHHLGIEDATINKSVKMLM